MNCSLTPRAMRCTLGLGICLVGAPVWAQTASQPAKAKPPANAQPSLNAPQRPAPPPPAQPSKAQPSKAQPSNARPSKAQPSASHSSTGPAAASTAMAAAKPGQSDGLIVLQHRLRPGEIIRTRTTHLANTLTRIQGTEDVSDSRTTSDKVWEIKSVNAEGQMTLEYRIEAVDMSQKAGQTPEVKYNSRTDKEVPPVFAHVAKTISEPVATVTIDASGTVIGRDNQSKAPALGMGELAVPLPTGPVAIGAQWSIPREARVKLETGTHKTIKLRERYTLEKVSAGIATIGVETQPLTPVNDPNVEAQLMQQMSRGVIKFDVDRGRLINKELNWDEEVVGFRGAETSLQYTARFIEELIEENSQSARRSGVHQTPRR